MCPRGAQRESARHLKTNKNCKKCAPKTHREKDYRQVKKSMPPGALNHSFRIRWVIKINMWPIPENTPKMLPKRLPKNFKKRTTIVTIAVWTPSKKHSETGCFKQCNIFENAPLNGPLDHVKINEKPDLGTPATTEPHFGIPGKALGVPLARKCTKID